MAQYRGYKGHVTQTYCKLYGYKNLLAWQAADDLAAHVHDIVVRFQSRYFKLASQMLGSASSVKANISEGYCRNALGDYIRFCEIARGSLGELGSQIQDCERWGLVKGDKLLHFHSPTNSPPRRSSYKHTSSDESPRAPTSSNEFPRVPTLS